MTDEPAYDKYPGGECFCDGRIGMGPCDDDLGVTDEDDDLDDIAAVAYKPIRTVDTGGLT